MKYSSSTNFFELLTKADYEPLTTSNASFEKVVIVDDEKDGEYVDLSIANWFLKKQDMSFAKLSVLCFYAQAWNFVKRDFKLMKTDFYAGDDYPLSKSLEVFFGKKNKKERFNPNIIIVFDADTTELLESVWETYGELSTNAIVALVEQELPYKSTAKRNNIDRQKMLDFYNSIAN